MKRIIGLAALVVLVGCGKASTSSEASRQMAVATYDVREAVPPPPPPGAQTTAKATAVTIPQIAYTYSLTFRLAPTEIAKVQQAHVAICDKMGIARCHIVTMTQNGAEHGVASGSLVVAVEARTARAFGIQLVELAAKAGGNTVDRGIEAEDLSKQIVDTEARIRAKQALADRLLEVLRTHKGGVADLVNAERALAGVQEEIDTAQSELADARGRVQLSTYKIDYTAESRLDSGAAGPLSGAWSQLGDVFGSSLAAIILLFGGLLPWVIVLVPVALGIRYAVRWWTRRGEKAPPEG